MYIQNTMILIQGNAFENTVCKNQVFCVNKNYIISGVKLSANMISSYVSIQANK